MLNEYYYYTGERKPYEGAVSKITTFLLDEAIKYFVGVKDADLEWLVMPALLLKHCSILGDVRDNGEAGDVSENHSADRPQSFGVLPRHEEFAFLSDSVSLRSSRADLARRRMEDEQWTLQPFLLPQIDR